MEDNADARAQQYGLLVTECRESRDALVTAIKDLEKLNLNLIKNRDLLTATRESIQEGGKSRP
jgi:hypothetical protein